MEALKPLVVVTRAAPDAPPLVQALQQRGLDTTVVPLIERTPRTEALDRALFEVGCPHRLLLTSRYTVRVLVQLGAVPPIFAPPRVHAVGTGTAEEARAAGFAVDDAPARGVGAEVVAALGDLTGEVVLYPHARHATPGTAEALAATGARVIDVIAYENRRPARAFRSLTRAADSGRPLAFPLLSGSAARRLADWARRTGRDPSALCVVAIGPSTEAVARDHGLVPSAVASTHDVAGLAQATAQVLAD